MNRYEKLFYHKALKAAITKLSAFNHMAGASTTRNVYGDGLILKYNECGATYLLKYVPQCLLSERTIELTPWELKMSSKCSGIVFIMPKGPPSFSSACDYEVLLCSAAQIADETASHLKGVRQFICRRAAFQYHLGRLLSNGVLL